MGGVLINAYCLWVNCMWWRARGSSEIGYKDNGLWAGLCWKTTKYSINKQMHLPSQHYWICHRLSPSSSLLHTSSPSVSAVSLRVSSLSTYQLRPSSLCIQWQPLIHASSYRVSINSPLSECPPHCNWLYKCTILCVSLWKTTAGRCVLLISGHHLLTERLWLWFQTKSL